MAKTIPVHGLTMEKTGHLDLLSDGNNDTEKQNKDNE